MKINTNKIANCECGMPERVTSNSIQLLTDFPYTMIAYDILIL